MKRMLAVTSLLALTGLYCSKIEEQVVSSLLNNYVTAQEALSNDDLGGATLAFQAIASDPDPEIEVGEVAQELAASRDLESVRSKFKKLSAEFLKQELPEGFMVVHCPIADEGKGADWVQKKGDIANPYLGRAQRDCGTIKEQH